MTRFWPRLVLLAAVAVLVFGACARDDDDATSVSRSTTTTSSADDTTPTSASGDTPVTTGGSPSTTAKSTATTQSGAGTGATDDPEADGVIEVNISGGVVDGGVQRRTVKQGAQVTLRFTSDAADEIHVHTYDLRQDLSPGQSADITFLAKIPGIIEVELENRKRKVLELEVKP